MKVFLKQPAFEELKFRQLLLADEKTMEYNHSYGGTISFSKDRWENWYKRWIGNESDDYFYRYIFAEDRNEFVGEAAYHRDTESNRYFCDVIVMDKFRGNGYGREGLLELLQSAKRKGIKVLYDNIADDNSSVGLFLSVGFTVWEENDDSILVAIEL